MSEYRNKTTGEVLSQGQVRAQHPNTSLPRVWGADTLAFLNVDPVLPGAQPTPSTYQRVERQGVEKIGDNWHEKWTAVEMFSDTTEDGVTTTKAEHEAAYQATLDAALATTERAKRDALLAETDYLALSDTTLSSAMTTYRQQLREVPQQSEFPATISWPTKP
tara:strand:+ start:2419 stop:2907 length:489 start_codon:yes stop_codon:yes gene_type:complete